MADLKTLQNVARQHTNFLRDILLVAVIVLAVEIGLETVRNYEDGAAIDAVQSGLMYVAPLIDGIMMALLALSVARYNLPGQLSAIAGTSAISDKLSANFTFQVITTGLTFAAVNYAKTLLAPMAAQALARV